MKCSFCGFVFEESEGKAGCNGCPMSRTCNKCKCPNCSFEMPKEPLLIKFIKRKWGMKNAGNSKSN